MYLKKLDYDSIKSEMEHLAESINELDAILMKRQDKIDSEEFLDLMKCRENMSAYLDNIRGCLKIQRDEIYPKNYLKTKSQKYKN